MTPQTYSGGYELFRESLVAEGRQRGMDARLVTPSGEQFKAVTRLLGLGRRFSHLGRYCDPENVDFAREATHVYLKGEPLDLLWWSSLGNRFASKTVGLHTPLRYPPSEGARLRNAIYASPAFGMLLGGAKLHLLSESQRAELPMRGGKNRSRVIPNGYVGDIPPRSERPPGKLRLLCVGRLTRQKGFDLLPSVLSGLDYEILTIVGEGPERSSLERMFDERAFFIGQLSRQNVIEEMAKHDVLLMPSRWEGHPFVLLESMAAGCVPVVQQLPQLVETLPAELRWLAVDFEAVANAGEVLGCLSRAVHSVSRWRDTTESIVRSVIGQSSQAQLAKLLDYIVTE